MPKWIDNLRADLPRFRCNKEVHAARIKGFQAVNLYERTRQVDLEGDTYIVLPDTYFMDHQPQAGGYVLVDDDGVFSYASEEDFRRFYAPLKPAASNDE